ncbi:SAM-dependent methyltransferase [Streptacidiphilus sp. N1-3]|uniref:SAM-dependent methyltransferase n=1 Tax=Streptacidiphilus alkalitolerans TaxID=3342712 RepID=A0ABV6X8B7_9ACTN
MKARLQEPPVPQTDLRTDIPHSARIYDYVLGGKDNFPADREAAEQMLRGWPSLRTSMRQSRAFMHRVTRHLAAEQGVRQFLDVGTGIPTEPNLHQVAQGIAPESQIVYVDNDPMVLVHARALLSSSPEGRTAYLQADMREPQAIISAPQLHDTFDLDQPVALSVIAVLQFVPDELDPVGIIQRLLEPLPSGSFLALSMVTVDSNPAIGDVVREYNARGINVTARTHKQVEAFFDGLELVDPGVVLVHRWRPDGSADDLDDADVAMYGGVARKP